MCIFFYAVAALELCDPLTLNDSAERTYSRARMMPGWGGLIAATVTIERVWVGMEPRVLDESVGIS